MSNSLLPKCWKLRYGKINKEIGEFEKNNVKNTKKK
jgi:hypothetical protein|tara:strand:+ start:8987 stop:9094 length:108 start_codon:yes stop_codon:yes gene_type:complete